MKILFSAGYEKHIGLATQKIVVQIWEEEEKKYSVRVYPSDRKIEDYLILYKGGNLKKALKEAEIALLAAEMSLQGTDYERQYLSVRSWYQPA